MLPKELAKQVPKTHLMSEEEWRRLGVQQSLGWVHYMVHEPGMVVYRQIWGYKYAGFFFFLKPLICTTATSFSISVSPCLELVKWCLELLRASYLAVLELLGSGILCKIEIPF